MPPPVFSMTLIESSLVRLLRPAYLGLSEARCGGQSPNHNSQVRMGCLKHCGRNFSSYQVLGNFYRVFLTSTMHVLRSTAS